MTKREARQTPPGRTPTWAESLWRQFETRRWPLWSYVLMLAVGLLTCQTAWVWNAAGFLLLLAGLFSAVQNTRNMHGGLPREKMWAGKAECLAGFLSSLLLAGYGAAHGLRTLEFALGLTGSIVTGFFLLFLLTLRKTDGPSHKRRDKKEP